MKCIFAAPGEASAHPLRIQHWPLFIVMFPFSNVLSLNAGKKVVLPEMSSSKSYPSELAKARMGSKAATLTDGDLFAEGASSLQELSPERLQCFVDCVMQGKSELTLPLCVKACKA